MKSASYPASAAADLLRDRAPAKINLFLHVGARRTDGFHELESLAVFADAADELAFEAADDLSLAIDGPFAAALQNEPDNLILRVARALAAHAKISTAARITLTKNLPVASGIGGGSADAAAALRGLCKLWNLHPAPEAMQKIALSLGSDVPVCLLSQSAWMEGRGEKISPVDLPLHISMVLINPGVAVSTAQVFERLDIRTGMGCAAKPENIGSVRALCDYLEDTFNDLERPARNIAPAISEALNALSQNGALLSRMSGSGATCFGIFENDAAAEDVAASIARTHPHWWIKSTHTT